MTFQRSITVALLVFCVVVFAAGYIAHYWWHQEAGAMMFASGVVFILAVAFSAIGSDWSG